MTPDVVIGFARSAIETTLLMCAPMLAVSLVVGVALSVLQAATQIQEAFPWLMDTMITFTRDLMLNLPQYIK
jgi:flagellar biosynthesis protein FliQ